VLMLLPLFTSDETRRWFVKHLGLTSRLYYTWSHLTLVVACGLRQVAGAAHQLWLCGTWAIAVAGIPFHATQSQATTVGLAFTTIEPCPTTRSSPQACSLFVVIGRSTGTFTGNKRINVQYCQLPLSTWLAVLQAPPPVRILHNSNVVSLVSPQKKTPDCYEYCMERYHPKFYILHTKDKEAHLQ
jgi:hypothetical protein